MGRRRRDSLPKAGMWFVTATVEGFEPVFADHQTARLVLEHLNRYRTKHQIRLHDYVVMPSHVHLIVETKPESGSLSEFMRDFKKGVSHALARQWHNGLGLWMDRFDDLLLASEETYRFKAEYIRWNPVKAGLSQRPEEYQPSSAWARCNPGEAVCPVDEDESGRPAAVVSGTQP